MEALEPNEPTKRNDPPRRLLALDPGTQDVGLAVLQDGVLVQATWVEKQARPARCGRCPGDCAHATLPLMRSRMVEALLQAAGPLAVYDLVAVEWPVVYQHQKAPADDLLQIAGVAAAVCAAAHQVGTPSWCFRPSEWKGKTAKDTFQAQILACLTGAELRLLPRAAVTGRYLSDPLDAVGLGLFAAGRLGQWLRAWGGHLPEVEPVKAKAPRKAPRGKQAALPLAPAVRGRRP